MVPTPPYGSILSSTSRAAECKYVYVIPERLATTIDVSLHAIDATHTAVHVTYTRTALDPAANDDVKARGADDRNSGPEWKRGLEACLHLEHRN